MAVPSVGQSGGDASREDAQRTETAVAQVGAGEGAWLQRMHVALEGPPVPGTAAVTGRRRMLLEQVLICTVTKAARGHEFGMTRSVSRSNRPAAAACPWGEMAGIPPVCTSDSPCTEIPAAPATGNLDLLTPRAKVRNEVSATFLSLRNFFPSRAIKAGVRHPGSGINSAHDVLGARLYF